MLIENSISIYDYLKIVRKNSSSGTTLWFRGQSNANFSLIPGALRRTEIITDGLGRKISRGFIPRSEAAQQSAPNTERMLEQFKLQARPFVDVNINNDFEWMFIAQHYGLPTRLLDWTTNALVALYFAVSGVKKDVEQFAVFFLDPSKFNKETIDVGHPIDVAGKYDEYKGYIDPVANGKLLPICVNAPHISSRIRSQSGNFTLHGSIMKSLDNINFSDDLITKIVFPASIAHETIEYLDSMGVNQSFIYPSLESIASDVSKKELERWERAMDLYFSTESDD